MASSSTRRSHNNIHCLWDKHDAHSCLRRHVESPSSVQRSSGVGMFAHPRVHRPSRICPPFGPTPQRGSVRAETLPENAPSSVENSEASDAASKKLAFMTRRGRRGGGKLKKSKRMEALAASLASKSRAPTSRVETAKNTKPGRNLSAPDFYQDSGTESDAELLEAARNPGNEVEIPYDTSKQKQHFENDPDDLCVLPKPIYIISDCTGDSAAKTVKAALGQFETKMHAHCPASLLLFRFVTDKEKICQIVEDASDENALVVFTLVDPQLVAVTRTACNLYSVKCVDLWSELLDIMEDHLDAMRSVLPMNHPERTARRQLDPEYFKRIEAVEYTRKMDDGAHPERWHQADILLLGVSRSGKTPLSIYLGQQGYKVANLPLVKGMAIPPQLYEIEQSKIFALLIDPQHLFKIRRSRMGSMGVANGKSMYAELKGVVDELEYARGIYRKNPVWPVLDVTQMGVEESAAKIERIMSDRHGWSEWVVYA